MAPEALISRFKTLFRVKRGALIRRVSTSPNAMKGSVAGTLTLTGYIRVSVDGRDYLAHRIVWALTHGRMPARQIDHINGCRYDNRPRNIREATNAENGQNSRVARRRNRCGLLGVSPNHKKWRATIVVSGKQKYLGNFDTPELAHAAYAAAKKEMHPFAE